MSKFRKLDPLLTPFVTGLSNLSPRKVIALIGRLYSRRGEMWASTVAGAKYVGAYFGVVETDNQNLDQWKENVENKMKSGDGGIPLKQAVSSSVQGTRSRILRQTERAISQLSLGADEEYDATVEERIDDAQIVDEVQKGEGSYNIWNFFKTQDKASEKPSTSSDDAREKAARHLKSDDEYEDAAGTYIQVSETEDEKVSKKSKKLPEKGIVKKGIQKVEKKEKETTGTSPYKDKTKLDKDKKKKVLVVEPPAAAVEMDFQRPKEKKPVSEEELTYGDAAYKHYKVYTELERKVRIEELKEQKEEMIQHFQHKQALVDEVSALALAYYNNPLGKESEEFRELKRQIKLQGHTGPKSKTVIRTQLSSLQNFKPYFTLFVIVAQIVGIGMLCGYGGVTSIGLEPQIKLTTVKTFIGVETVHKWEPPNIWIGPSQSKIIALGGVFAPCVREDYLIQMNVMKKNYSTSDILGCCEQEPKNTAATTTEQECEKYTNGVGEWKEGVPCGERPIGENYVAHNLKPCCRDVKGTCELLSHKHCYFLEGIFHEEAEHCREVNCLSHTCKWGGLNAKPWQPWLPANPNQWFRWPLALVYHHGIIHVLMVIIAEVLLMRKLEITAGWFRICCIFMISGMGGLVAAALFSPYQAHVGSTGAVFGMVGVITVELIQFWRIINKPWLEVLKIAFALLIFMLSGTMPYLDNFTIVTGYVLGIFCAFIFLPYVTFGYWHTKCRLILIGIAIPCIFTIYFLYFYMFFVVQMLDVCVECSLFNCVSYTENMCKVEYWH